MRGSSRRLPSSACNRYRVLSCCTLVRKHGTPIPIFFSRELRYCQDQMGHQFGLHGHLRVRISTRVLERVGLRDVVWKGNDSRPCRHTAANFIFEIRIGTGKHVLQGRRCKISNLMLQAFIPSANITAKFPMSTMVFFQFVFAAITVVLLAGGVLARMNFRAWMIFCPLWLTFSYTIGK